MKVIGIIWMIMITMLLFVLITQQNNTEKSIFYIEEMLTFMPMCECISKEKIDDIFNEIINIEQELYVINLKLNSGKEK